MPKDTKENILKLIKSNQSQKSLAKEIVLNEHFVDEWLELNKRFDYNIKFNRESKSTGTHVKVFSKIIKKSNPEVFDLLNDVLIYHIYIELIYVSALQSHFIMEQLITFKKEDLFDESAIDRINSGLDENKKTPYFILNQKLLNNILDLFLIGEQKPTFKTNEDLFDDFFEERKFLQKAFIHNNTQKANFIDIEQLESFMALLKKNSISSYSLENDIDEFFTDIKHTVNYFIDTKLNPFVFNHIIGESFEFNNALININNIDIFEDLFEQYSFLDYDHALIQNQEIIENIFIEYLHALCLKNNNLKNDFTFDTDFDMNIKLALVEVFMDHIRDIKFIDLYARYRHISDNPIDLYKYVHNYNRNITSLIKLNNDVNSIISSLKESEKIFFFILEEDYANKQDPAILDFFSDINKSNYLEYTQRIFNFSGVFVIKDTGKENESYYFYQFKSEEKIINHLCSPEAKHNKDKPFVHKIVNYLGNFESFE